MKTKISLITTIMFISFFSLTAKETKTEEFKVFGNCGMCETRIEKAANSVEGVTKAEWDKVTKMVVVTFDDSKTDLDKIHIAIADVGHDTKLHKADDEVYSNLPGCCKYDRSKSKIDIKGHEGHKHSGCDHSKSSSKSGSCCGKK